MDNKLLIKLLHLWHILKNYVFHKENRPYHYNLIFTEISPTGKMKITASVLNDVADNRNPI